MKARYAAWFIVLIFVGLFLYGLFRGRGEALTGGNIGLVEVKGTLTSSEALVNWIEKLRKSRNIKGILVRVDSPGGGVVAAQEIYQALRSAAQEKPVVVSMGALAASGGYYVALAGDPIVANPGTITGSIGVILEYPVIKELLDRLGIRMEVIKSSEHKDIASPFRPLTPKERALLDSVIQDVYRQFVGTVAEARGLPEDSVLKIADGRILTGQQAYAYGLVDTLGTFQDALEILKEKAGVERAKLAKLKKRRPGLLDILFGDEWRSWVPAIRLDYRLELGR